MKTKILANFQICISVSLNSSYWEKLTYSKLAVFSEWKFHKLALVSRGLTFAKLKILRFFFQLLDGLKKQKRVRIFSKNEHIRYWEMYIVLHEKKWNKQISTYNFWKKCIFKNSSHGFEVIIVRKIPILRKHKLPSRLWIQNPYSVKHLSFYFKQSNHETSIF